MRIVDFEFIIEKRSNNKWGRLRGLWAVLAAVALPGPLPVRPTLRGALDWLLPCCALLPCTRLTATTAWLQLGAVDVIGFSVK